MEDTLEIRARQFDTFLRERGKRRTQERTSIVRKALSIEGHFDVEELHHALEQDGFHVSLATAYSTVDLMYEAGLLRKHTLAGHQARFEAGEADHLHLVCLQCGKIQEAEASTRFSASQPLNFPGFTVNYYSAAFYGLCASCSRKNRRERRNRR